MQCCLAKARKIKVSSIEDNVSAGFYTNDLVDKKFIQTLHVINENRTLATSQPLYHKSLTKLSHSK
jgi:hypothetical protein